MTFEMPKAEVVLFAEEDIITTSSGDETTENQNVNDGDLDL